MDKILVSRVLIVSSESLEVSTENFIFLRVFYRNNFLSQNINCNYVCNKELVDFFVRKTHISKKKFNQSIQIISSIISRFLTGNHGGTKAISFRSKVFRCVGLWCTATAQPKLYTESKKCVLHVHNDRNVFSSNGIFTT